MAIILGIETSCDETGAAIFDSQGQRLLANKLYSQITLHKEYGGVVPEIASRSQLEKIDTIVEQALFQANISFKEIDAIAVTHKPGLVGALLVGISFAKSLAWSSNKKLIGVNHLEGHIFSTFLKQDYSVEKDIPFPHISLTASGGHTALYLVHDYGRYECLAQTEDDAAGEAFDKISKIMGLGYPGGPLIESYAAAVNFIDSFNYPRLKKHRDQFFFSFSGLKTAVLYHLVDLGYYDLQASKLTKEIPIELQECVASSLLNAITDIFCHNVLHAFKKYPAIKAFTFGGGVACNKFIKQRFAEICAQRNKLFFAPAHEFCTDNGAMIAFVGGYKAAKGMFSNLLLDAER